MIIKLQFPLGYVNREFQGKFEKRELEGIGPRLSNTGG
jgi:hypothetical protein